MREAQIIDGMIDLLVENIHTIGVRSKRKVVAGIARDIEKVYGKERLLVEIAGAAIEAPPNGQRSPWIKALLARWIGGSESPRWSP